MIIVIHHAACSWTQFRGVWSRFRLNGRHSPDSEQMVGKPYLGITSGLLVTRPEPRLTNLSVVSKGPDHVFERDAQVSYNTRSGFAYFFNPAVKFVITVTDWLTCCETTFRRIFLPSGDTS